MPARSIDEALADAHIPDAFADFDLAASRREISREATAAYGTVPVTGAFPAHHDQAGKDLHAVSAQALHRSDAAQHLARLDNNRRIDPDGALHFACLLNLAGYPEGAQFWWQFAAGAGNATAAHCLSLLHLARGEYRDAQHWSAQALDLADPSSTRRITVRHAPADQPTRPSRALLDAVRRLTVEDDEEFGSVPHPAPFLADHIEELADAL